MGMHSSKETTRVNIICILLVIVSAVLSHISVIHKGVPVNNIQGMMMMAALYIWCVQMRRRLLQEEKRRYLTWMVMFMSVMLLVKLVSHSFLSDNETATRYVWYFYYTPIIYSVLCVFYAVLCIGKPWNYRIEKKWKWLYIPAALLSIGMMTNDLHQWAFRFAKGAGEWHVGDNYTHCIFYYLSMLWVIVLVGSSLVIAMKRCRVTSSRKHIWMPLLPLAIGLIYMASVYSIPMIRYYFSFNMAEFFAILSIAFTEGMIQAGLIHSNDDYENLWNLSAASGGILDQKGRIRYHSGNAVAINIKQAEAALKEPIPMHGGDLLLHSQPLRGGIGYWTEDVSKRNSLNRELEEYRDILTEENAMLEGENKLAQRKARIAEKTRLYDKMASTVGRQLEMMRDLLNQTEQIMNEADAKGMADAGAELAIDRNMQRASLLAAYIKRHSNLLLLSQQGNVQVEELYLAASEVLEYLRMCGFKTYVECIGSDAFDGELILLAGEFMETAIENSLPYLRVWMSLLEVLKEPASNRLLLQVQLTLDTTEEIYLSSEWNERIKVFDGEIKRVREEETSYITLWLTQPQTR